MQMDMVRIPFDIGSGKLAMPGGKQPREPAETGAEGLIQSQRQSSQQSKQPGHGGKPVSRTRCKAEAWGKVVFLLKCEAALRVLAAGDDDTKFQ